MKTLNNLSFFKIVAALLIMIGLIIIIINLVQTNGKCEDCGLFSPVNIIFIGGIVLMVGAELLNKLYKDRIKELLENDNDIEELISKQIDDFLVKSNLEKEEENTPNVASDFDTVIVPATHTIDTIINHKTYSCPNNRTFKTGLKYIAFYKAKEILGYGEIIGVPNEVDGNLEFRIKEFIPLQIQHQENYAFVQNKRYCRSKDLKIAKTTQSLIYNKTL